MEEGQKLYNWLHLAAGHAMIFANISWASTRQNLSSGFQTKRDSNQSPHLQRLPTRSKLRVARLENANDKGADQSARSMHRLVCAFVVRKPPRQVFSRQGPVDLRKYWDKQCGPKSECSYILH